MIDYNGMIALWRDSVRRYCVVHNIPSMDLKNLRMGDLYNYDLYIAYKNVESAITEYKKTPLSPFYINKLVNGIKRWYFLSSDSNLNKVMLRITPNSYLNNIFDYINQRTK